MPQWNYTVDVSDIWKSDTPFTDKRDYIVSRILESQWYSDNQADLEGVVHGLSNCSEPTEFNLWWVELYDWWLTNTAHGLRRSDG